MIASICALCCADRFSFSSQQGRAAGRDDFDSPARGCWPTADEPIDNTASAPKTAQRWEKRFIHRHLYKKLRLATTVMIHQPHGKGHNRGFVLTCAAESAPRPAFRRES